MQSFQVKTVRTIPYRPITLLFLCESEKKSAFSYLLRRHWTELKFKFMLRHSLANRASYIEFRQQFSTLWRLRRDSKKCKQITSWSLCDFVEGQCYTITPVKWVNDWITKQKGRQPEIAQPPPISMLLRQIQNIRKSLELFCLFDDLACLFLYVWGWKWECRLSFFFCIAVLFSCLIDNIVLHLCLFWLFVVVLLCWISRR